MSSPGSLRSKTMTKPAPLSPHGDSHLRRQSAAFGSSPTWTTPRVQLVPHARTPSYDGSLSPTDIELLANTNFDAKDMSSKDFDFEDVFTYDKPQRKLKSVVEVSSPTRDWPNFGFPHHPSNVSTKQKHGRTRSTAGEMYKRNQDDARRR